MTMRDDDSLTQLTQLDLMKLFLEGISFRPRDYFRHFCLWGIPVRPTEDRPIRSVNCSSKSAFNPPIDFASFELRRQATLTITQPRTSLLEGT